jgi:hypothetical protein
LRARRGLAPLGYLLLAGVVAWWTWRALHDPNAFDLGLAYKGGQAAWATGHPEHLATWVSTPFLGAAMAIVTRLMSVGTAADLLTLLNLALVVGLIGITLHRLRSTLSPLWWWLTALALVSFAPMMSTVWWKQFNIIALALAVAGFAQLRLGRKHPGGALIGLSVAVKPLAILLPLVLLARRGTRRAGAWAIGYAIALNVAAQGFMAARAQDLGTLNLYHIFHDFANKTKPSYFLGLSCLQENFAPGSLLCRLVGGHYWTLQHLVVWALVALLGVWVIDALRGRSATSWELFAFTCALSTMVSPIAWSHYQIMLAPLFLLLVVRFSTEGATVGTWSGLAAAFFLASLMLEPYGTVFGGHFSSPATGASPRLVAVEAVAQFAQYVLVVTGVLWFVARKIPRERGGTRQLQETDVR